MTSRGAHVDVAGGDGRYALGRVEAVGLDVERVVEEVGAARGEAEAHERDEGLPRCVALVEHTGRAGRGEHEDVLDPLLRTGGARDRPQRRPAGDGRRRRPGASGRGVRDRPTSEQGYRADLALRAARPRRSYGVDGRRLRAEWLRRSTRAPATTARTGLLFGGRVGKDAPGPTPTARSTRRSRRSASPAPRPSAAPSSTSCSIRLQRELFVVGAELATAPENRDKLDAGVSRVTAEMVDALEPIIDDVTDALRPAAPSSCCRARTASPPRSTSRAPIVRRAERAGGGRGPRRAGSTES